MTTRSVRPVPSALVALCLLAFAMVLAACGGGGGVSAGSNSTGTVGSGDTAPAVTMSVTGGGTLTGGGTACSATCQLKPAAGTTLAFTAAASSGQRFVGWTGACAGQANPCSVTVSSAVAVGAVFAAPVVTSGAPKVLYVDVPSGPTSGGENGQGAYLSVFGLNLGDASGLGTRTRLFIGGVEVANYRALVASQVADKLGVQQLTVQVGSLGAPAQGKPLPVKVVVDGVDSNIDQTFTPNPGRILFVSLGGNDGTALAGDIARPWRYLQNGGESTGVMATLQAGDHVVLRGGDWRDATGVDGTWIRLQTRKGSPPAGSAGTGWIHFTAYPGPIRGNAIEDVHYTTPDFKAGGIHGPSSIHAGQGGEYISVSNLRMDVAAKANTDAAPLNMQYTVGHWRLVNNLLGPWPSAWLRATDGINARAAGISGHGKDIRVLGNRIRAIGGDPSTLENHGIYADTTAEDWEVSFNWIHDITGGSLIQFFDNEGLAGQKVLPDGSRWRGFTAIRVHHNWLENSAKYGLNLGDPGANGGAAEMQAWNNVIIGAAQIAVRLSSTADTVDITYAHNTLFDNAHTADRGWFFSDSKGAGARSVRVLGNVLAFGPRSVGSNAWFVDYIGTSTGWSFRDNLYYDSGLGRSPPAADAAPITGDPRIVYAQGGTMSLLNDSAAIDRTSVALPFSLVDDVYGRVVRPLGGARDVGAIEVR